MKIKTAILLITILISGGKVYCQSSYSFTRFPPGTFPYDELINDITATDSFDVYSLFNIDHYLMGEVFPIYGNMDTIGVNASFYMGGNGFMEIDDATTLAIFDAAVTENVAIDSTSRKSFSISGAPGNLIVKFQYKNWKLSNGPAGNYCNFQIWIHQQTGIIEFRYGSRSANNASGYTTANGPNAGIFWTPSNFSGCLEKLWCTGNPNNPVLDSNATYVFSAMQGLPDSGTVFQFVPDFPTASFELTINNAIDVYPNPFSDELRINSLSVFKNFSVYDISGKKISEFIPSSVSEKINTTEFQPGVYFFVASDLAGNRFYKKLIKQ